MLGIGFRVRVWGLGDVELPTNLQVLVTCSVVTDSSVPAGCQCVSNPET